MRIETFDQPADRRISVLEKACIGLVKPHEKPPDVECKVAPGRNSRVERGQAGAGRDNAKLMLPLQACGTHHIPADIVPATIFLDELTRHMMGEMTRAKREIEQKRPVGRRGLMVAKVDRKSGV